MGKMELPAVDQLSNALLLLMGDKFGTLSASGELNTDAREVRRIESTGGLALSLIRGQPHSGAIASETIRNEGWIGNLNLNIT